ncbi:MAG TPA: hypothetical protein VJZ04_01475 [Lachnospiraceae bacterium]|nr:hypothetical protein [Lachnospiraceae bacterium]
MHKKFWGVAGVWDLVSRNGSSKGNYSRLSTLLEKYKMEWSIEGDENLVQILPKP